MDVHESVLLLARAVACILVYCMCENKKEITCVPILQWVCTFVLLYAGMARKKMLSCISIKF